MVAVLANRYLVFVWKRQAPKQIKFLRCVDATRLVRDLVTVFVTDVEHFFACTNFDLTSIGQRLLSRGQRVVRRPGVVQLGRCATYR